MILTHCHVESRFGDALLALAYPQACAICGASVEERKFGVACESVLEQYAGF